MVRIVLFEPNDLNPYGPITLTRHLSEFRTGIYTNLERAHLLLSKDVHGLWGRPALGKLLQERHDQLAINRAYPDGAILLHAGLMAQHYQELLEILAGTEEAMVLQGKVPLALRLKPGSGTPSLRKVVVDLPMVKSPGEELPLLATAWDALTLLPDLIQRDLPLWLSENDVRESLPAEIQATGDDQIFLHPGAELDGPVRMDGRNGPIVIDAGVKIESFAVLQGPLYLGPEVRIKSHTRVSGSSIGRGSRIGGEVKGAILHEFSNKIHEGYLGDSILGSWVNLGAGTNTSNLKNNYSHIRINWEGKTWDTERQFLGTLMGDHSKTAIATRLNTGTTVGAFCNVFQGGFPPRCLPSFSWGDGSYELAKALETADRVLRRRNQHLTPAEIETFSTLARDTGPFLEWDFGS